MNGRAFANDCPITDATQTSRTVIAVILRRSADAGEWVDDALSPDVGVSLEVRVRADARTLANSHRTFNNRVRSDLNTVG